MKIMPLNTDLIDAVSELMGLGTPYIRVRTHSDYWLYAQLFSSTCPVAVIDGELAGAVVAFRSQDNPDDIYIQDVITHPDHRRLGVAAQLLAAVSDRAAEWNCQRLYLTSEPDNEAAHRAWMSIGFENLSGDRSVNGISVIADFKGAGKDRAVYQITLPRR